jgi:hypothetical protein
VVNGTGVFFILSHADLTRSDKDSRCSSRKAFSQIGHADLTKGK